MRVALVILVFLAAAAALTVSAVSKAVSAGSDAISAGGPGASEPMKAADPEPAPPVRGARALLARAMTLVDLDPRSVGATVRVAPPRKGVRAEFDPDSRVVTLYADPRDPPDLLAHDIAHELGHAFDTASMTRAQHDQYLRRRGHPGTRWWAAPGTADYAVGAGDFAEVFSSCFSASPEFRGRLGPRPPYPCALLPAAARRLNQSS
jgi:hypothetical protein